MRISPQTVSVSVKVASTMALLKILHVYQSSEDRRLVVVSKLLTPPHAKPQSELTSPRLYDKVATALVPNTAGLPVMHYMLKNNYFPKVVLAEGCVIDDEDQVPGRDRMKCVYKDPHISEALTQKPLIQADEMPVTKVEEVQSQVMQGSEAELDSGSFNVPAMLRFSLFAGLGIAGVALAAQEIGKVRSFKG